MTTKIRALFPSVNESAGHSLPAVLLDLDYCRRPNTTVMIRRIARCCSCLSFFLLGLVLPACKTPSTPGSPEKRKGDEMVVAGQLFHTGTKIVLWMDPGGYDAYRVVRRFSPLDKADWRDSAEEVPELRQP